MNSFKELIEAAGAEYIGQRGNAMAVPWIPKCCRFILPGAVMSQIISGATEGANGFAEWRLGVPAPKYHEARDRPWNHLFGEAVKRRARAKQSRRAFCRTRLQFTHSSGFSFSFTMRWSIFMIFFLLSSETTATSPSAP